MAMKTKNTQNIHISNTLCSENLSSFRYSSYFDISDEDQAIFNTDGYPNTIKWAVDRLLNMFEDDYSYHFPSLDVARKSNKKQRKTRSYSIIKILVSVIKMTCIRTLRIGRYNKANRWTDASIEKIAASSNVTLSNTKKILILLSDAGFINSNQKITALDVNNGVFKISTKSLTKNFIEALNLKAQRIKEAIFFRKENRETRELNSKLPPELRSDNTAELRMVKSAEKARVKKAEKAAKREEERRLKRSAEAT